VEVYGIVYQLFIHFKKTCDSIRREVIYIILSGIPVKLIRLIKMCLNETYNKFCISKNLLDVFPVLNGLKQGYALSPLLFNFGLECTI
jgi:hypothetical protein